MTNLFDGMAGLLSDTFGSPVIWHPEGHGPITVQSIFRKPEFTVAGEDGRDVLTNALVWRVPLRADWPRPPRAGDRITPWDGVTYCLRSVHPSPSPAGDRFLECECEVIE